MKKVTIVLGAFLALWTILSSPFLYYIVSLPSATEVLMADEASYPKEELDYPKFLRCALHLNSEDGRWIAYKLVERMAGSADDAPFLYNFKRHVMLYPVRFKYPFDARKRLYFKYFGVSEKYPNLEAACHGIFGGKACAQLSEREAVLLGGWMQGGEKLVERLDKDEPDVQERLAEAHNRCTK